MASALLFAEASQNILSFLQKRYHFRQIHATIRATGKAPANFLKE
jgi:hypothetical protein